MSKIIGVDPNRVFGLQEEIVKRKSSVLSFVVGEVFQHRAEGLIPQCFGNNFKTLLWEPAQEKRVSINAFGGKNILKKYVLPKNMNDTTIQSNANSTPMEEDQFWAMLYLLIINPKLGKKILKYELRKNKIYVFHVKLDSGKIVAVLVSWHDGGWCFHAHVFGYIAWCLGVFVFLFPSPLKTCFLNFMTGTWIL